MDKDKLIKAEIAKLNKLSAVIPEDKKVFADRLIKQLAFMQVTLMELNENINKRGAITVIINGNGKETLSDIYIKQYNSLIKNYNSTLKQLSDMIPVKESEKEKDELLEYMKQNN